MTNVLIAFLALSRELQFLMVIGALFQALVLLCSSVPYCTSGVRSGLGFMYFTRHGMSMIH